MDLAENTTNPEESAVGPETARERPQRASRGLTPSFLVSLLALLVFLQGQDQCPGADTDDDGWTVSEGDCDDESPSVYPDATELCDDVDNDCDGEIDEGLTTQTWYADNDGDGAGDKHDTIESCLQPPGYVADSGDCDDADSNTYPFAVELCDETDNDCDGIVDEAPAARTWYIDQDGDGYGTDQDTQSSCIQPDGYQPVSGDCDDADANIHPGAAELCDTMDNDCDDMIDEDFKWFADEDGDAFGDTSEWVASCSAPDGYSRWGGDCNDQDPDIHPAALEVCNGRDDDCNGVPDDISGSFVDADGDGFGGAGACTAEEGTTDVRGDCDDQDESIHPGALDPADDGIDQDCGGHEGPDPHVGLSENSADSIPAALEMASDLTTIWVGPGEYDENFAIEDRTVSLKSTVIHGAVLSEEWPPISFDGSIGADTVFDGFRLIYGARMVITGTASPTIRNCIITQAYQGDAVQINGEGANPILRDCQLIGNGGDADSQRLSEKWPKELVGAGVSPAHSSDFKRLGGRDARPYLENRTFRTDSQYYDYSYAVNAALDVHKGSPFVAFSRISGNYGSGYSVGSYYPVAWASGAGAGVYLEDSSPTFLHTEISENEIATIYVDDCPECTNSDSTSCYRGKGGGVYAYNSSPSFVNCAITGNTASYGGGIYGSNSHITLTNSILDANSADSEDYWYSSASACSFYATWCYGWDYFGGYGGGIALGGGSLSATNCVVTGNDAVYGGGISISSTSTAEVTNTVVDMNEANIVYDEACEDSDCIETPEGGTGGGISVSGQLTLRNAILTRNTGYNLYQTGTSDIAYSVLYSAADEANHNLESIGPTTYILEPGFLQYDSGGLPVDHHLALDSVLVNAGDPAINDPDGSRSDIGVYSGPGAANFDLDGDGYMDYFWPGTIDDAPAGFDPNDWDSDDQDPGVPASR